MERRKKANTPLEQIYFNTQDIKQLEESIAPFYNCSIDLSNDSVSVAVSNTNLPTDITKAYITDYNGNVYKFIAFNDDKTTAYIEYYASLKGADGRDGADDIDDTTTASNKLWSSEKTSTEITNATKIKVVYTTTDTPTTSGSSYIFDKNNITPAIIDASIIGKELYQIVDDKIKYAYRVNMILNDDVYTSLIGEFGGGKQLYEHNIEFSKTTGTPLLNITLQIRNDDNTPFTAATLKAWLSSNGYIETFMQPFIERKGYGCFGYISPNGSSWSAYCKIQSSLSDEKFYFLGVTGTSQAGYELQFSNIATFDDNVKDL